MDKTYHTNLTSNSHKARQKICFERISMISENKANLEFHSNCNNYFDSLRKNGKNDFEFEDEYFFTLPAISEMPLD